MTEAQALELIAATEYVAGFLAVLVFAVAVKGSNL